MRSDDFRIGVASEFTADEIKRFKAIVQKAGEVDISRFDSLISNDPILLMYPTSSHIEAVGALKIPNVDYKNRVFKQSQSKLNPSEFTHELGWVVSLIQGIGNGKEVTKILSNLKSNIYATVKVEKVKMRHKLEISGFIQDGVPYKSRRGDYFIALYIKK